MEVEMEFVVRQLTCSTVASTFFVSVVVMVCLAIGCSLPIGTGPTQTVLVGLLWVLYIVSQYKP